MAKMWHGIFNGQKGSLQVTTDNKVPLLVRQPVDRVAAPHACIINQNIEATKCVDRRFDRFPRTFGTAEVFRDGNGAATSRDDFCRDQIRELDAFRIGPEIGDYDDRALFGE